MTDPTELGEETIFCLVCGGTGTFPAESFHTCPSCLGSGVQDDPSMEELVRLLDCLVSLPQDPPPRDPLWVVVALIWGIFGLIVVFKALWSLS